MPADKGASRWSVRFNDGSKVSVEAEDIQDAIRAAHLLGGVKYTLGDIIEVWNQGKAGR